MASLQAQLAASQAQVVELADELRNIRDADTAKWDHDIRDQFEAWARNRAQFALSKVGR